MLLDTSGFLAAQAPDQRQHLPCAAALAAATGPLVLSPFVLAELDYLVTKALGVGGEIRLLAEVARRTYSLEPFGHEDVGEALAVVEQYRDLPIGLADASLVVLSRRLRTLEILTLDERHFRVLRGAGDRPFRILPADR